MFYYKIYLILLLIILSACSANKKIQIMPTEQKWQTAENYFNRKKYTKAAPYYEQLLFERNSIYTADAQFKLAECYFRRRKYVDAIFEYQELLRLFPDNRLACDAQYQIGISYTNISATPHYDQSETEKAIEAFIIFIEKYPDDHRKNTAEKFIDEMNMKLIEKVYINGYIYYKMKDFPASQLYLKEVMGHQLNHEIDKKSAYYNALIHIDRKEQTDAQIYVNYLKEHYPDSKELISAEKRLARIFSKFWRLIYFY